MGPWLQLVLQNVLWAFIENQEYTLAEVPMFLNPSGLVYSLIGHRIGYSHSQEVSRCIHLTFPFCDFRQDAYRFPRDPS